MIMRNLRIRHLESVVHPHKLSEYAEASKVGAAILTESGNIYF